MPELPEVERLRQSLVPAVIGARVERALALRRDVFVAPSDPPGGFSRMRADAKPARMLKRDLLEGLTLVQPVRLGKQLALVSREGPVLVVKLGMTGALTLSAPGSRRPAHTHGQWTLACADGATRVMRFIDPRRFGGVWIAHDRDDLGSRLWSSIGPDALAPTSDHVVDRILRSRSPIKAVLLDQRVIGGIGNIYADEALFAAGVAPRTRADRLDARTVRTTLEHARVIMRAAIDAGGSTIRDYRDANGQRGGATRLHAVYGRAGEACVSCDDNLTKAIVAGRTTVWCERCQPAG